MSQGHTFRPTDEFRDRLEREVLRRQQRPFERSSRARRAPMRRTQGAAIVALSLVLGATAGFASAQIGHNAERDSLLAAARAEASLAIARLDLARAQLDEIEKKVRSGVVSTDALTQANAEVAEAERRRNRLAIDIEEITATGRPPRDDLNAPVVEGRDFVQLRIQADMMAASARLKAAEAAQAAIAQQVRAGGASNIAGSEAALDVESRRVDMLLLVLKGALRSQFLRDATPIEKLTGDLHRAQLRNDAALLQKRLGLARERLALVERQRSMGVVGDVELLRARLEVKETELGLQKVVEQLRAR